MRSTFLRIILVIVMALPSHLVLHAQIRIIPRSTLDSLSQAKKVSSIEALRFDALTIDYGSVKESDPKVERTYRFTNVSSKSVVISGVSASCSCVTARADRKSVAPGQVCEISVVYDQKNHPGRHDRYIYLYILGEGSSTLAATLSLTGLVLSSDAETDQE